MDMQGRTAGMKIDGVPALVTGGGSGLGEATARGLAAAGARVGILDANADNAVRVAGEIGGVAAHADVTAEDEVAAALEIAAAAHGPARILVNCAGIGVAGRVLGRDGPMPLAVFQRVIAVNLVGSFNALRLASAAMADLEPLDGGERGVIISTASVAAYEGQIGQAAYSASKGGIVGMTLPIAREFARIGIRVLAIAPGLFRTPLLAGLPAEVQETLGASIPFPSRLGDPAEFALLVRQMVENPYLNGETIRLDGALRMPPR
jgi:NAD(P)-dependent dehydrogenase (short-subunit alcohol dehydrogenase family)